MNFMRIFTRKNKHQRHGNYHKKSDYYKSCIQIKESFGSHCLIFASNLTANNKNIITRLISDVNVTAPTNTFSEIKFGVKITSPTAPADKFANQLESTRSNDLLRQNLVYQVLTIYNTNRRYLHNQYKTL